MPTLNQYKVNDLNGRMNFSLVENPVIEPLDGPLFVEHLMLRFPEEIYSRGRDTHLYKFLTALVGESGAGILKKKSLIARMQFENAALNFQNLDNLYSPLIGFDRLPNETYTIDPKKSTLTEEEWRAIDAADKSYRNRAINYIRAARQGGTRKGIEDAASAAIGRPASVIENYRAIFDKNSDSPLGVKKYGFTDSVAEFIIRPEISVNQNTAEVFARLSINDETDTGYFNFIFGGVYSPNISVSQVSSASLLAALKALEELDVYDVIVQQTTTTSYIIKINSTVVSVDSLSLEVSNLDEPTNVSIDYSSTNSYMYTGLFGDPSPEYYNAFISHRSTTGLSERVDYKNYLDPYIQKNLDALVSRIQPQGTIFSVSPSQERYSTVGARSVFASSERFVVSRFVSASPAINYPQKDLLKGLILEAGVENEERNYPYVGVDMPTVFLTINAVIAYSGDARRDSVYGTQSFYAGTSPAYKKYISVHSGKFFDPVPRIYPFLKNVSDNAVFDPAYAIPNNNTYAIVKSTVTV